MFHTQGIVLKKTYYREFDEIFTVFTKDFGKIEVLGRGIKKSSSKLASHTQVFDFSEIEFVLGKKIRVLTGANLINNFHFGAEFFSFLDGLLGFDDSDENIWNLTREFTDFKLASQFLFLNFFKFRLLSLAGFSPDLESCASCSKKLAERNHFFSAKEKGIVCGDCFTGRSQAVFPILSSTIKILRIFKRQDKELLGKIKISESEKKDLEKTIEYLICD